VKYDSEFNSRQEVRNRKGMNDAKECSICELQALCKAVRFSGLGKGATRGGAKGAEAPPLVKQE